MENQSKRSTKVYGLTDGREIVYFGITNNPSRREAEHLKSETKQFTKMRITSGLLTRESAERREGKNIKRCTQQHAGKSPRYNIRKTS